MFQLTTFKFPNPTPPNYRKIFMTGVWRPGQKVNDLVTEGKRVEFMEIDVFSTEPGLENGTLFATSEAAGITDRIVHQIFVFPRGQIFARGISQVKPNHALISEGTVPVRSVVGGTGQFSGAKGELFTVRNTDNTYTHAARFKTVGIIVVEISVHVGVHERNARDDDTGKNASDFSQPITDEMGNIGVLVVDVKNTHVPGNLRPTENDLVMANYIFPAYQISSVAIFKTYVQQPAAIISGLGQYPNARGEVIVKKHANWTETHLLRFSCQ